MALQNSLHSFDYGYGNLEIKRSVFDFSHPVSNTFDEGDLFLIGSPIEIMPSDTFSVDLACFVRMAAQPLKPVMGNAYLDVYAMFVPSRLLWSHFEEEHGANKSGSFTQTTEYVEPQLIINGTVSAYTLLDGLGVPPGQYLTSTDVSISMLPLAGYVACWNEWFRNENYERPVAIQELIYAMGNNSTSTLDTTLYWWKPDGTYASQKYSACGYLPVNRYHDYFSSVLPLPQKGADVTLPLGTKAPIMAQGHGAGGTTVDSTDLHSTGAPIWMTNNSLLGTSALFNVGDKGKLDSSGTSFSSGASTNLTNLYADLSNATAATINDLRSAFALQRQFERDARGGTRYTELIKSNFGSSPTDARLDRPEYLGGFHVPIGMNSVSQTTTGTGLSQVGAQGGNSVTAGSHHVFTKSFTEFGWLYFLGAVRVKHMYSQGLLKNLRKKRRFDYYYPTFAFLGEQPVTVNELQLEYSTDAIGDSVVWGFQEAWAHLRYFPAQIQGQLRKGGEGYSDYQAWTYGDTYDTGVQMPSMSAPWLFEGKANIGNVTALGANANPGLQFIGDFEFSGTMVRPMPVYSEPSLKDFH